MYVGTHVTRVRLADDFAAIVSGKTLSIYDLAERRQAVRRRVGPEVRALALAPHGGAAWIEERAGRRELRDITPRPMDDARRRV